MSESVNYPGVVLITGAAGGMGANHARALATRGTHVCIADVADCSAVVEEITAAGGSASAHELDVTDAAAWTRVVDEIRNTRGELGGLVNNAGISRRLEFMDTPDDVWELTMRINLFGPFYGMKPSPRSCATAAVAPSSTSRRSPGRSATSRPRTRRASGD